MRYSALMEIKRGSVTISINGQADKQTEAMRIKTTVFPDKGLTLNEWYQHIHKEIDKHFKPVIQEHEKAKPRRIF